MSEQKLVPVESTSAMDIAGAEVMHGDFNRNDAERVWRAMVSAAPIPAQVAPSYWNSQRKMIERAIVGLRDGWATREDAYAALAVLGSSYAPTKEPAQEVTQQAAKADTVVQVGWATFGSKDGKYKFDQAMLASNPDYIKEHDSFIWEAVYLAPTTSTVSASGALAAPDEWSYSTDEERYHEAEPSRLAILQYALAEVESRDEGAGQFWIGRNVRFTGKGDAGSIIEALQEQAYDQCGEFAETYLKDATPAEEAELESLVSDWAKRVDRSNFWTVTDVECFTVEEARTEIEVLRTQTAAQAATDKSED